MKATHLKVRLRGFAIVYCLSGVMFQCLAQDPALDPGVKAWKRYELSMGSFSVLLPDKPVETHLPSDATMVIPVEHYSYSVVTQGAIFVSMRALIGEAAERWPVSADSAYYDGFWNSFAVGIDKQMEGKKIPFRTKLLERQKATLSGYVGQEFVFSVGSFQGRVLITRIGRHSFMAALLRPETTPAADAEKFFSSFTINRGWLSAQEPVK